MTHPVLAAILLSLSLVLPGCSSSEEQAEGHFQSALELVEQGDIDRALVELRNVFQLNGSHLEARHLMAKLLLEERKDQRAAYGQYLRLVEQYPDDLEARVALARIAIGATDWEEVERHGARAAELGPDAPEVQPITIAREYRQAVLNEDETARTAAAEQALALLEERPNDTALRTILIDHSLRNGAYQEALTNIDWVLEQQPDNEFYWRQRLGLLAQMEDVEGMEAQMRDMVQRFPGNNEHKSMLLRFYLSRGQLDEAETFLRDIADASTEFGPKVDLIRFLAELRGREAAKAEVERRIAESEDPEPFRVIAAGMDFNEGRQAEAVRQVEEVIAATEPSDELNRYKVALAKMLSRMGNDIGARTRVEEVIADDPDNVEALKMQAAWHTQQDDADAAIAALRTALAASPDDAEALTLMAQAYTRNGQPELARDFFSLAVEASGNAAPESIRYAGILMEEERYLPAEDVLLSALRLTPNDINLLTTLGQLYLRMDDVARVEGVVKALQNLDTPEGKRAANTLEAERLNRTQGPDQAIAYLEALATASDANLSAQINLVRARLTTGDTEGALELARSISEENGENEGVRFMLAMTETAAGNLDVAETIYRSLLEGNPKRPEIWMQLANMKQRKGEREEAQEIVREGLSKNPESATLLWAEASFREQDGDIDGAIEIYDRLYDENSGSPIVANNLASLLSTYRDDEESLDRAWRIARRFRDTEIPAMQDTYGWILHRRGESTEALPYLEAAAEGLPGDPIVKYHLAEAYMALDRAEDARRLYLDAVETAGPVDTRPQIEDARGKIQQIDEVEPQQ